MEITFYRNNSPTNKIGKSLSALFSISDASFKNPYDEETPTIRIAYRDFNGADYVQIEDKYYFISGVNHINNTITDVSLQLDYLETYKNAILNATAYIDRATSGYQKLLHDDMLAVPVNNNIRVEPFKGSFISKFSDAEADGAYVLVVNKAV